MFNRTDEDHVDIVERCGGASIIILETPHKDVELEIYHTHESEDDAESLADLLVDMVHPAQNNWIPVEEGLPEEDGTHDGYVLAQEDSGQILVRHWTNMRGSVAWQPLPDPYEPPVKFEKGDLVEHKSGARMFYASSKDKNNIWVVSVTHSKEMGVCWPVSECRKVNND